MKEIAIIGPTASGKSDLALELAQRHNAYILSIDSLSIYKEIDIASAKPSKEELVLVKHFGINELFPDEYFGVTVFFDCYRQAKAAAESAGKNLVIVGGTSFYLKSLITGLSPTPDITPETEAKAAEMMRDPDAAYTLLYDADPAYMQQIEHSDRYRIEKMLLLYLQSGQTPTEWFQTHPPVPVVENLPIYEIDVDRAVLRERIALRTQKMVDMGLVDEVAELDRVYGRKPNSMKAIGIVEVLDYLDGYISKEEMIEQIVTHTAQLAKRQQTFNRNQFTEKKVLGVEGILEDASAYLAD
ncbi:MAG: tRNA (adenosine(37)-N6)-dimethylallyltransferase MiaA [Sulfurimonadaceae bacterium]|nr:tRNA (adenosine(37)-N6)-dimethylallyltransferase MiaA [Sulfurimonadaceae bacterium]